MADYHKVQMELSADGQGLVILDGQPLDTVQVGLESSPEHGTIVHLAIRADVSALGAQEPEPEPAGPGGWKPLNPK